MSFIQAMAEFEKLKVTATEKDLQESLFSEHPAADTLLAFVDGRPVAYIVYYFTFSTMVGKRDLWLDDLFVAPEFRGKGVGKALMDHMAHIALQNNCGRFEWAVLDWNTPAIDFYKKLGATVMNEWRICRLDEEKLRHM